MLCEEFSHDGVREGEESPGEGEIPVLLFTTLELAGGKNPQILDTFQCRQLVLLGPVHILRNRG